ncbi:MAG: hypothetical protein U0172_11150 [Nitrospiraceae bacterium]
MHIRTVPIGGLTVRATGGHDGDGSGNGPLVILLHGFGAPGDDLVPLAEVLEVPPGTRFLFPEGPLSLNAGYGDARAWWMVDMNRIAQDRAAGRMRDMSADVPRGLPAAREAIESFLAELPKAMPVDPTRTVLGGFSQGAMLSCDHIMRTTYPCAALVQLSGSLLARMDWQPSARRRGLPVFHSHGTHDEVLPFQMAERLRDELTGAGLTVDWHAFRGGHELPHTVLARLGQFLTRVLAPR